MNDSIYGYILVALVSFILGIAATAAPDGLVVVHGKAPGVLAVDYQHKVYRLVEIAP